MKGDEGDGEGREKEKKGSSIQYPKMTRASTTIKTSMLLQLSLHHHEPAVQRYLLSANLHKMKRRLSFNIWRECMPNDNPDRSADWPPNWPHPAVEGAEGQRSEESVRHLGVCRNMRIVQGFVMPEQQGCLIQHLRYRVTQAETGVDSLHAYT